MPFELFRDRNFTIMNLVGAVVSIGIIGFFLPVTIYLQSVLGYSALKAGLVLAPSSVVSMVVAPFAGRMADRVGGKYILVGGLSLFAVGHDLVHARRRRRRVSWTTFMAPMVVMGVGHGLHLRADGHRGDARRAARGWRVRRPGVNNTIRQVGSVIGSAAVGALLQNRLAAALREEATARAGQPPPAYRDRSCAASTRPPAAALEVGAGQTGASQTLPPGLPAQVVAADPPAQHAGVRRTASYGRCTRRSCSRSSSSLAGALACLACAATSAPGAASESPHVGAVTAG